MTQALVLETAGGPQQVRVFSPRGCHLIAMLSRTERAKRFRAFVLDVLDLLNRPPVAELTVDGPVIPMQPTKLGELRLTTYFSNPSGCRMWPVKELDHFLLGQFPVAAAVKAGVCTEHMRRGPLVGIEGLIWHATRRRSRGDFNTYHRVTNLVDQLNAEPTLLMIEEGKVKCLPSA